MTQSLTTGVHHVGLALPDIEAARDFFCDALGYEAVGGASDYPAHFVSDGSTLITLWQVSDPETANAFDRKKNIGLHHLAIGVADDEALAQLFARVSTWPEAEIEFEPCPMGEGSAARHFICAIPGGARVEFATPLA
jgi:catechol 2,3-dioxygenase-like lactoylglutathione lyase family enzyme